MAPDRSLRLLLPAAILVSLFFLQSPVVLGQNDDYYYSSENFTTFLPEVVGYDGWYNNPSHPEWGGADMPLSRRVAPTYADGTYEPITAGRPNPHDVATKCMLGDKGLKSYRNRTALLTFFGQQVVEEILDAQRAGCPPEYFNIPIPKGHALYDSAGEGGKALPFLRSRYDKSTGQSPNNPRQQLNEITPYIDGGLFYGVTKAWADALRSYVNGTLACNDSSCNFPARNTIGLPLANPPPPADHVLKSASRFFKIGNPRGNENPMLLAMGVIWFRNHNWHANRIRLIWDRLHVHYNDEILYNRARQWNIAEHQNIVLNVWLPSFLGVPVRNYTGYSPSTFPGITHAFQTSAMRFGHTMIPPVAYRASAKARNPNSGSGGEYIPPATDDGSWQCDFRPLKPASDTPVSAVRTCQSYWNSPDIVSESGIDGVDELLFGLSKQVTEREDNIITEDLRGFVFGSLDFSRRDLMAVNIQRGRDHGIPDYNTVREAYNLKRITRFYDINPEEYDANPTMKEAIDALMMLYTNATEADVNTTQYPMDNIDLWPAGLLETTRTGPGEVFRAIILDQYLRIRDSDRFWFENYEQNKQFTKTEYEEISRVTFRDIMIRNIKSSWFRPYMLQSDVFHWHYGLDSQNPCYQPAEAFDNATLTAAIEPCSAMKTFDYFDGSAGPYIGTIISLGLYMLVNIALMVIGIKYYQNKALQSRSTKGPQSYGSGRDVWLKAGVFSADNGTPMLSELVENTNSHTVVVAPLQASKQLRVFDAVSGSVDRTIDLIGIESVEIRRCNPSDRPGLVCIRFPHRYDLVLDFSTPVDDFLTVFVNYLQQIGIGTTRTTMSASAILMDVVTKEKRKELVEAFFRALFQDALSQDSGPKKGFRLFGKRSAARDRQRRDVLETELTRGEFAESMGMKDSSLFVEQVFRIVDKDNSGTINFQEFLQFVAMFTTGDFDSKMELMFNIYDLDGNGELSRNEFVKMLKHLADEAGENIGLESLDKSIKSMIEAAGLANKEVMTVEDFKRIFGGHLEKAEVQLHGHTTGQQRPSITPVTSAAAAAGGAAPMPASDFATSFRERLTTGLNAEKSKSKSAKEAQRAYASREDDNFTSSIHVEPLPVQEEIGKETEAADKSDNLLYIQRVWENYRLHIFWFGLYLFVTLCIFAERAYYYSVEREHAGLRRIAGYGVTVTRGAASAMMFTYSSLLVTMSRNVITKLRETPLNRVVPFDAAHSAHKAFAMTALFFTVMHIVGHCINFYHISTQTANDLTCLFREYYHLSDELPKFQFWMFDTLTGVTGYVLTLLVITIYVFALPVARRYLFNTFWWTHHFYVPLYGLLILHGSARLVQPPIFQWFFIGPVTIYALDKLISLSRKRTEIIVYKAEKLPSGVTHLQFKKPTTFNYLSGQWCRIACLSLNTQEYHPFTLTSAPHENTLDLYIRAVGPWTQNIRSVYDPENAKNKDPVTGAVSFPRLYLDGPFGEGHQDWYKFEVAVLVGGGIGVTPFASILKDLVCKRAANIRINCKKVYFLWVTRTQKQFEWLTDIIRQVEEQDKDRLTDTHIFITQFYQKFDLRTIMLYICERHFQKISNRSLFTGLRSVTHFGRPQFNSFFEGLQQVHADVGQIGTFSCGPPPMTRSVEAGCNHCNQIEGPVFHHHYENF